MTRSALALFLFLSLPGFCSAQDSATPGLQVWQTPASDPTPPQTPKFALILLGGHGEVGEATKIFCEASGGGSIVVLTASVADEMNSYFHDACPHNSVTSFQITSSSAARDPSVAEALRAAHAIFITGGDQSNYVKFWSGSPVQSEIDSAVARGVPIAGISAGLAVLGEFSFSSLVDTISSPEALADPYDPKITLSHNFLDIHLLRGVITDSHFSQRNRLGRTIVFLSRILQDNSLAEARAIGVDETTAVVIDSSGHARVLGKNSASFILLHARPEQCAPHKPLTVRGVEIYKIHAGSGGALDLRSWQGAGGQAPRVDAVQGVLRPSS